MQSLRHLIVRRGIILFAALSFAACCAAALVLNRGPHHGLLQSANLLGPAAQGILQGKGLTICATLPGQTHLCESSARMPLAPLAIAALYAAFHQHVLAAALVKSFAFFLPVLAAFWLAWSSTGPRLRTLALFTLAVLLLPTLDNIGNLSVEEGYLYGWLALAVTILLFPRQLALRPRLLTAIAFVSLTLTYLTKSSTLLLAATLALALAVWLVRSLRRPRLAAALLLAFACVPLLWGLYQRHAGGRFTVGTSLDGLNLYKGNNPSILAIYPPPLHTSLDPYDALIFSSIHATTEWTINDQCAAAARAWIFSHPAATLRVDLRKAWLFFLSIGRYGAGVAYPRPIEAAFTLDMLLFRLMLLSAIALSLTRLLRRTPQPASRAGVDAAQSKEDRFAAAVFLLTCATLAAPYIVGFALTRHATVLILPAAACLCRPSRP